MPDEDDDRTVLLTGASGLVGTWLRRTAPRAASVVSVVHRTPVDEGPSITADLREADAVDQVIRTVEPRLVIHAAMTVDEASIVTATEHVARATARHGADLLFVSTDAVFSGDGRSVGEDDHPDPIWDYGRWKARAERAVLAAVPTAVIVRLPLVVSLDPEDKAVERIRLAAEAREIVRWFDDELRQPAMASDIAPAIWRAASLPVDRRTGPLHLVGPERLSRYEIARRVARSLGLDTALIEGEPTAAGLVRPRDLHLRTDRARAEIGWDPAPVLGGAG